MEQGCDFDKPPVEALTPGGLAEAANRALMERSARESRDPSDLQFRAIAEFMPQMVWVMDRAGWAFWYNQRWYDYTGATPEEATGFGWFNVVHPDHVARARQRFDAAWTTGAAWEDTYPLRRADGEYRWFLGRAVPLRDSDGRITRWFGTDTDITEHIEAERLQELLGKEIRHRVKNSLALVASLLTMQARELDGAAREAIEDGARRVRTVAHLHDLLWRGANTKVTNLSMLVGELCAGLQATSPKHALIVDLDPLCVAADKAIPLALILNELVMNAFKHAYAGTKPGQVRVALRQQREAFLTLEVRDFGVGLPRGFDIRGSSKSLGIKVITALAKQLHAELSVVAALPGTRFTLRVPLDVDAIPGEAPMETRMKGAA
jgi:PAS domain S-box-containing protein